MEIDNVLTASMSKEKVASVLASMEKRGLIEIERESEDKQEVEK